MKMKYLFLSSILLLFLAGCTKEDKNLTFTGSIEAEEINISSEISGTLDKIFAEEGQSLKAGDKIASMDTSSLKFKLKEATGKLNNAKAQLQEIINGTRSEEIKKAKANLESTNALLSGAKKKYEYTLKNLNDLTSLYDNDAISRKNIEDAQSLVDASYANFESLQKQYEMNKANLDLLLKGATGEKIRMAQSQVDVVQANIDLLNYEISKGEIQAPINGVIQTINYSEKELLPLGGNLATLIDLNNLWVKIYVPEKQLHKISLNQVLKLHSDALKKETVTGKIIYISPKAEFTPKNVESKENKEEMVFEVKIKIIKASNLLKPGMLVDVSLEGKNNE